MKTLLLILCVLQITLVVYASSAAATCGGCMSNGVACLNDVEFTTCYNGKTTHNLLSCSEGERCTAGENVCEPIDSNLPVVCPYKGPCNICTHSSGRFACVNETHYGFCFGRYTTNLNAIGECPENFVCSSLAIKEICVPAHQHKPSCINTVRTFQAPEASALNKQELFKYACELLGNGPHAYPGNCKRYLFCRKNAGKFIVEEHDCPNHLPYFDRKLQVCQETPQKDCI